MVVLANDYGYIAEGDTGRLTYQVHGTKAENIIGIASHTDTYSPGHVTRQICVCVMPGTI